MSDIITPDNLEERLKAATTSPPLPKTPQATPTGQAEAQRTVLPPITSTNKEAPITQIFKGGQAPAKITSR